MKHNFGLIPRSYDSDSSLPSASTSSAWQRFTHHLTTLNDASPATTSYRLLFLARHGQGIHNVAESYYGEQAWNCYWSALPGTPNGGPTWFDAHLTRIGVAQAQTVHDFWASQMRAEKMPTPQSFYVSPLDRTLETADVTWSGLDLGPDRPYKPVVKELLREGMGIHTCDKRSPRSYIQKHYPAYTIEAGFAEEDPLWLPDLRESRSSHTARLTELLDDIFAHDESMSISMTAHSGTIGAILRAVGHRVFTLQTGAVIPVLVKVERVDGRRPQSKTDKWEGKPECVDDPLEAGKEKGSFEEYMKKIEEEGER